MSFSHRFRGEKKCLILIWGGVHLRQQSLLQINILRRSFCKSLSLPALCGNATIWYKELAFVTAQTRIGFLNVDWPIPPRLLWLDNTNITQPVIWFVNCLRGLMNYAIFCNLGLFSLPVCATFYFRLYVNRFSSDFFIYYTLNIWCSSVICPEQAL